jgi:shikimate dehydrogenase
LCRAAQPIYRLGRNNDKGADGFGKRSEGGLAILSAAAAQSVRELIRDSARRHEAVPGASQPVLVGIASSRSPQMHEREGGRLGLAMSYVLIDLDRYGLPDSVLPEVLSAVEDLGFAGVNVTHPFKQLVIEYLADLAPEAAAIGAVNTVVFEAGRRTGHNTDCWGFAEGFRTGLADARLDKVVQFGAGGGGAAVAYALLELGAQVLEIYDRDQGRAVGLAERLTERFGRTVVAVSDPEAALGRASGVVNATPVGMVKYPGFPFETAALTARHWVADIVYFPPDTPLLQRARALGCRTLAGTGMAIFQAVKAFELFTGIKPDREAMARHFEAA